MPSVSAVLHHSLFTAACPELEAKRRQDIATIPSRYKRVGALGLHHLAVRHPERIETILGRRAHKRGYQLVGRGFHSDVYRRGPQVLKVLWRTTAMTEPERQTHADQLTLANEYLTNAMGRIVLPETTKVATHPFIPKQRVVQIEQPYHEIDDPKIFTPTQPTINEAALAASASRYPGLTDALKDFCASAQRLHARSGMMPDTNGPKNLVISRGETNELVLIDGQPIPASDNAGIEITKLQVAALTEALGSYN